MQCKICDSRERKTVEEKGVVFDELVHKPSCISKYHIKELKGEER